MSPDALNGPGIENKVRQALNPPKPKPPKPQPR